MCGISGVLDLKGLRPVDPRRLQRMNELLAHRGPDGADVLLAPGLGLAHRRLAIIDPAEGAQPMANEDGGIVTVYNGEIYNFLPLRDELRRLGHRFRTRCDTEVIVHGYEAWGQDCLARFRGMFAFALWDARDEALFLARDRLGEKPLYYGVASDGFLVFASELPAVVAGMGGATPDLDPEAVADYLAYGYVPDPKSVFRGVRKLPPGHRLAVHRQSGRGLPEPERYWRPRFRATHRNRRPEELAAELIDRLSEAVGMRMIADVPLGAFLSGGIDSSAVVAMMAGLSAMPVTTCQMAFADRRFDESPFAAKVAARYGTAHVSRRVDIDAAALIDRLAAVYGEPFADASALPTYLLSGLARERVTVALSGDGGDELFAGYRRHALHAREERVKRWLPAAARRALFGPLARLCPKLDWAPRPLRAKATLEALAEDAVAGYLRGVTILPAALRARLMSPELTAALDGYDPASVLRAHAREADTDDPLARAQHLDLRTWLPGRMLVKIDRASMAHGLEVRPPLLDHVFVEWAAGLPRSLKLGRGGGKRLFKRALEPYLPREILHRPKRGFDVPIAGWLREGITARLDEALGRRGGLAASGLVDMAFARRLATEHAGGRRDHSSILWTLIMFDAFLKQQGSRSRAEPARELVAAAAVG